MGADELPPAQKYPPIDLGRFVELAVPKIKQMPILKLLEFSLQSSSYKELGPVDSKVFKHIIFYEMVFVRNDRNIKINLFSKAGGYFGVTLSRPGGWEDDTIHVSRYFELYDQDSNDSKCLDLYNFTGSLEEQVDKSLTCINRILEERFEAVLKGDEWMDVPSSFYDYK